MVELVLKNIKKSFLKSNSVIDSLLYYLGIRKNLRLIKAIDNINIDIKSGSKVAIVGSNGAGKTTLLRLISGIYNADAGLIKRKGRLISLIGLSNGLKFDLDMVTNIYLICALFGEQRYKVKSNLNKIINFAELRDKKDIPISHFSEGMIFRLLFSISKYLNPDILILDELTRLWDKEFDKKVSEHIDDLSKKGKIILISSHSKKIIKDYCNYELVLEKGSVKSFKMIK